MNIIVVEDGSGKGQCDAHGRAPGHARRTVPLEITQRTYKFSSSLSTFIQHQQLENSFQLDLLLVCTVLIQHPRQSTVVAFV